MRQSPKPYAKEQGEADPSSSPVQGVLPRQGAFVHRFVRGLPKIGQAARPFVGVTPYQPPVCPVGQVASGHPVRQLTSIAAAFYLNRFR